MNLPFEPKNGIKIMQGFHGPWSHKELSQTLDLSFAVDFIVPLGTEVCAAEDGVVLMVYDLSLSSYRGEDPEIGNKLPVGSTNFVYVEHRGGIVSVYSHLENGSSMVSRGQTVFEGQGLAKTGLSGWVGPTPHLHFQLFRRSDYKSVAFRLKGYSGSLEHSDLFSF